MHSRGDLYALIGHTEGAKGGTMVIHSEYDGKVRVRLVDHVWRDSQCSPNTQVPLYCPGTLTVVQGV